MPVFCFLVQASAICPNSGHKRSRAPRFLSFVVDLAFGSQHVASLQSGRVLGFVRVFLHPESRASDYMSGELV